MATAAASLLGGAHGLKDIYFVEPLFAEQASHIDFLVRKSKFELRSDERMRCTGQLSGAVCSRVHALTTRPSGEAVERLPDEVFTTLFGAGLQYGPAYRCIERMWEADKASWARLLPRIDRKGTALHPADLDAALQLSVLSKMTSSSLCLPFGVREANLCRGTTCMWTAIDGQGSALLANESGDEPSALLDGVQVRASKAESQLKGLLAQLELDESRETVLRAALAEKDGALAARDAVIAEKDAALAAKDTELLAGQARIEALEDLHGELTAL